MNLGLFLAIGESFEDLKKKGQLARVVDYNIKKYSQAFDKIYIFSYANETFQLPKNCVLVPNKTGLHRYLYAPLIPLLHFRKILDCGILRGYQITGGIPCAIAKIFFGKPYVINYGYHYSKVASLENKKFQASAFPFIEMMVGFFADAVIVTSPDLLKYLARVKKRKIHQFPSAGVDLKLFRPGIVSTKRNILRIIYIGRFEAQKNLRSLIEAVGKIKKTKIKLTLAGEGSQKKELMSQAKNLSVNLEILPPQDYKNIPRLLCQSDIFTLPSQVEGNSKILIEAMACGTPVIGANVEGVRQIIKHKKTGILCQTSPNSIKQAIGYLIDPATRFSIARNAREFIEKHYDFERLFQEEVDLLRKVADEKS